MSTEMLMLRGQTLLLDADDTLWENNIYFERAIANFISYLDHKHHTPAEVRAVLNHCEHETILAHGYGLGSFTQSLLNCFQKLSGQPASADERERIVSFARSIAEAEIELRHGVGEVLPQLATRHRLILMTKGNPVEQLDKLRRSGLEPHFSAVEVVAEKHAPAYHDVVERHSLTPQNTWMIGNSPKSDINPALEAGLHAVFLFHKDTWVLEHAEVRQAPAGQYLFEASCFTDLLKWF